MPDRCSPAGRLFTLASGALGAVLLSIGGALAQAAQDAADSETAQPFAPPLFDVTRPETVAFLIVTGTFVGLKLYFFIRGRTSDMQPPAPTGND